MKKIISILLTLIFAFSITACSRNSASDNDVSSAAQSSSSEKENELELSEEETELKEYVVKTIQLLYSVDIQNHLKNGGFFSEDTDEYKKGLEYAIENNLASETGIAESDRTIAQNGYITYLLDELYEWDIVTDKTKERQILNMKAEFTNSIMMGIYPKAMSPQAYIYFQLIPYIDERDDRVRNVFAGCDYITIPEHDKDLIDLVGSHYGVTADTYSIENTYSDEEGVNITVSFKVPDTYSVPAGVQYKIADIEEIASMLEESESKDDADENQRLFAAKLGEKDICNMVTDIQNTINIGELTGSLSSPDNFNAEQENIINNAVIDYIIKNRN